MAGGIDEALHDRINRKIRGHDVVDISACGIFKVPNPLREINKKAYEPLLVSIGPYHHGKEHLKAMEVQKMNSLKSILGENSVEIYVTELKKMETKIRGFYLENLDHIGGEELVEMMLLDGFFIIWLIFRGSNALVFRGSNALVFHRGNALVFRGLNALGSFYGGNVERDLLLVENQLPFSVLSKLYSLCVDPTGPLINDANDIILRRVIRFFGGRVPGLPIKEGAENQEIMEPEPPIIARVGNQDGEHMLGLLHDNVTRTPPGSPRSATAVCFPWWQPCLAWASRLQFPRWLPCLAPVPAGMSELRKGYLIPSATELNEAGIKFQKKRGKLFDIEFQKEVMSIPTLAIDDHTESTFRNFVAYEQCYTGISSTPFTDYITFMDCLISTGKDVELLSRCGVLDNWLGDNEVVATMFNRLGDAVSISVDFFYYEIFKRVNKHCSAQWNLWQTNLWHNYFNSPWAMISFIAAVVLLLCTLLQTLFSILSYRH